MKFNNEININNSDLHYSCGYHDLTPFSPNEKYLVFCSISSKDFQKKIIFSKNNVFVDINLFEIETKKITFLYKTKCYTSEQGVRINWIDNKRITINDLDENKLPQFVVLNVENKNIEKVVKNYFCHQISGLEKEICLSIDYSQIHSNWPSYGFHHKHTKLQSKASMNIFNWKKNILLHKFNLEELESYKNYKCGFIGHPSVSENGEKVLFMHRIPIENIVYSWLYYVDLRTRKIELLTEEKVTHYTWINNDKFLIYQRLLPNFIKSKRIKKNNIEIDGKSQSKIIKSNSQKKSLLKNLIKTLLSKISSGFVLYKVENKRIRKKLVCLNLLGIDCHPFFNFINNKIYLDSYPNKNNDVEIYSIDLKKPFFAKKEKVLKGDWKTNVGKLDAHIRVSDKGNYICIDDLYKKMRAVKIFKINNKNT